MNKTLQIIDTWIRGLENLVELCQNKDVFQAIIGDKRIRAFGVLIDVFSSLKIIVMSLKEVPVPPVLYEHIKMVNIEEDAFIKHYQGPRHSLPEALSANEQLLK